MSSTDPGKEKLIAKLLLGGAIGVVGGILLMIFGTGVAVIGSAVGAGGGGGGILAALGPIVITLGAISMIAGLFIGFAHNRAGATGIARPPEEGRIQARFAVNHLGEMIFDNVDFDAPDGRYYVKALFLDGRREELECGRPVFDQCGEGMRGMLLVQGRWLTQFTPLPDSDETREAYRGL